MNKQIEKMADILCEAKEHNCNGGNDCKCVKQATALYDAGCRMTLSNNWISVKDRLPEKNGQYLTFGRWCKAVFADYWIDGEWKHYAIIGVTHWMPFPEPPKRRIEYDNTRTD